MRDDFTLIEVTLSQDCQLSIKVCWRDLGLSFYSNGIQIPPEKGSFVYTQTCNQYRRLNGIVKNLKCQYAGSEITDESLTVLGSGFIDQNS